MLKLLGMRRTETMGEVVAHFGDARLIRLPDGSYDLVGGTENDLIAAQEWVGFFLHEAVIGVRGGTGRH
ncbi:MAG TPA: hypothetical protein VMF06_18135 [Candidatus Limnocylindria bacterium]|jgi:hypothetical protein|nr:hypothetical protein [Candidatus Limnocylindria bacterium]